MQVRCAEIAVEIALPKQSGTKLGRLISTWDATEENWPVFANRESVSFLFVSFVFITVREENDLLVRNMLD